MSYLSILQTAELIGKEEQQDGWGRKGVSSYHLHRQNGAGLVEAVQNTHDYALMGFRSGFLCKQIPTEKETDELLQKMTFKLCTS